MGDRARSALQHLAAGVIVAAVAIDLVPSMVDGKHLASVFIGFVVGTLLVLGLRLLDTRAGADGDEEGAPRFNIAFLATLGIDLAIDGFLVGIALAVAKGGGAILAIAIAIEVLAIGLAFGATTGSRGAKTLFIAVVLASILVAMGLLGIIVAGSLEGGLRVAVIAFGCVALLYLVVEELLAEAHKRGDTALGSMLFFVGFGIGILLTGLEG